MEQPRLAQEGFAGGDPEQPRRRGFIVFRTGFFARSIGEGAPTNLRRIMADCTADAACAGRGLCG